MYPIQISRQVNIAYDGTTHQNLSRMTYTEHIRYKSKSNVLTYVRITIEKQSQSLEIDKLC